MNENEHIRFGEPEIHEESSLSKWLDEWVFGNCKKCRIGRVCLAVGIYIMLLFDAALFIVLIERIG